ncbi:MAG: sodium:hydrogen antiporter [Candidatus Binatia bacterium]|nr:MAG: sodium:hydrogen antiporter [Candidatus Binatia bacterium]
MPVGVTEQIAAVFVLGIAAHWVAWRLRLPSILVLLATGVTAGPVLGYIEPDLLLKELLFPLVSLGVAIILYEGGLNLQFRELSKQQIGYALFWLVTIAVVMSWAMGSVAARYLFGFPWPVAILLGAILVVTGPTVIGPLLRDLRLRGRAASLLKWEGIVVDPLGAILAIMVFTVIRTSEFPHALSDAVLGFVATILVGVSIGCLAAVIFVVCLRRFWAPDVLHNPISLMLVVASSVAANAVVDDAGLLAATVMGMVLANQKWVPLQHIVEFKETLTIILISVLFVTLAARLDLDDLRAVQVEKMLLFAAAMILLVRPVSVLAATVGTGLEWRERIFLAAMAPRGIVAAAVASVFALDLASLGYPRAAELVPVTLLFVFVTVSIYGFAARPLARSLGLVQFNPQGILFVGAHDWARAMAEALMQEGCAVLLVDTKWDNIRQCRMAGLPCIYGNALAERTREEIDFGGLGRLLAVTPNNEVNVLVCLRYREDFGRKEVYHLAFPSDKQGRHEVIPWEHHGRILFGKDMDFARLSEAFRANPKIFSTKLTQEFDFQAFRDHQGKNAILLFVRKPDGSFEVCTADDPIEPQPGDTLLWLPGPPDPQRENVTAGPGATC